MVESPSSAGLARHEMKDRVCVRAQMRCSRLLQLCGLGDQILGADDHPLPAI
jgi:hypothetical protein